MSFSAAVRKTRRQSALANDYRRGDIVQVLPFDWPYTAGDKRDHWIVRVTTPRAPEQAQDLVDAVLDANGDLVNRRTWNLLVDNVPAQIRQDMQTFGEVTVSLAAIRTYIQNRLGTTY